MEHSVSLKIADTIFKISCDSREPVLEIKKSFKVFVSTLTPTFKVSLEFDKGRKRRKSPHLYRAQFFDIDIDFTKKEAFVLTDKDFGVGDIVRALSAISAIHNGGFLLHASSVLNKGYTYVFFGPSGSGKTTIAKLSGGKIVLTDETTAITARNGHYDAYSTPFAGDLGGVKKNTGGPIKAAFFIKKGPFDHRIMTSYDAVKGLFCSTIRPFADIGITDRLFGTFENFVKKVPCYELYFRPEKSIWRYIDGFIG